MIFLMFVSSFAIAQSLSLSYSGSSINNGDTILVTSADANVNLEAHISVTNISSSNVNLKAKKTELSLITGSTNSFCDWNSCFPPNVYVSTTALDLAASVTNSAFLGEYSSKGNVGESTIMYTFFNTADNNDSVAIIVKYYAGFVGIDGTEAKNTISNAYPNPAKDAFYLDYDFSDANTASVEILNVVGSLVKVQEIQGLNGKARIDVSNLNNGIYFYSVIVDGKKYVSKKLIVQK